MCRRKRRQARSLKVRGGVSSSSWVSCAIGPGVAVVVVMLTFLGPIANARIQPGVDDIGDDLENHHSHGDHHQNSHHDRRIGATNLVEKEAAHTGPGKDALRHDSAAQQERQVQANHRDNRQGGVFQGVDEDNFPARQTLRAGSADIVLTHHFQHGAADIAAVGGKADRARYSAQAAPYEEHLPRRLADLRVEHAHCGQIGQPPPLEQHAKNDTSKARQ